MDILESWKSVAVLVVLTSVIVVGLVRIHKLRKDARGEIADETSEVYQALKDAYESGQIASSEFERIRASLGIPPDRWPELRGGPSAPETEAPES